MLTPQEKLQLEEKVVAMLKTVFDPEIPVDIYSLGLVYGIDIDDDAKDMMSDEAKLDLGFM